MESTTLRIIILLFAMCKYGLKVFFFFLLCGIIGFQAKVGFTLTNVVAKYVEGKFLRGTFRYKFDKFTMKLALRGGKFFAEFAVVEFKKSPRLQLLEKIH